jgi:PAS domain S-box-containing protein
VENSPDLIVRLDRVFRRTYVNPAFIQVSGLPKEELLGREFGSAIKESAVQANSAAITLIKDSLHRVRDHGRPIDFECGWPMADGYKHFSVHMEPEFDAAGALASILAISRDITEIKAGQEKLRQMETDLAHVSRLTMMGELAVAIAHEINQPLTALATNANAALRWLAANPPDLDEARRAMKHVVGDAAWAGEVIARIRALLKKDEPIRTPLNLHEVVEKTLALAQPELARHQVSVQTDLDAKLPPVEGDHVQLQQVLLNLLINALDSLRAAPDRPRLLQIRASHDEPGTVRVSVRDSGVGIDPAHADRLFEAFFTTKPHGFGMGLAISYSIIEAHGGRLWMTPNDGPGVTFHFTVPVPQGGAK